MACLRTIISGVVKTCKIVSPYILSQMSRVFPDQRILRSLPNVGLLNSTNFRCMSVFGGFQSKSSSLLSTAMNLPVTSFLTPVPILAQPVRTRILYSRKGGNARTVKAVIHRFFRLYNGLWIRTRAGRHKKRWAKSKARIHRLKAHVVCNRTQCQLLDKMVNIYFKTPKYYVNDPYAPYHRKSNLPDYRYQAPKFLP